MLVSENYGRIACPLDEERSPPSERYACQVPLLPTGRRGVRSCLMLDVYDPRSRRVQVRWLGIPVATYGEGTISAQ